MIIGFLFRIILAFFSSVLRFDYFSVSQLNYASSVNGELLPAGTTHLGDNPKIVLYMPNPVCKFCDDSALFQITGLFTSDAL